MSDFDRISESYFLNTRQINANSILSIWHENSLYTARILHAETGHFNHPTGKRLRSHVHDVYHIKIVTGGRGFFMIEDDLYPTEGGRIFLVGPDQSHCFMNAAGESTIYTEVTFEFISQAHGQLQVPFHEFIGKWLNQHCHKVISVMATPVLKDLVNNEIENIIKAGKNDEHDSYIRQSISLSRILLTLYEHVFRPAADVHLKPVERVYHYLHRNYAQKLDLNHLADIAHLTPNHLSRQFRKDYGLTPVNYQLRLRINAACAILETTEDSLKYVAMRVGFADHYYFSRMFKKIMGIPPGRFRKDLNKEQEAGEPLYHL